MLGNPRKAILSMAGPLIIAYLILQLNTFLDLAWCSGLGPRASSSVSSMAPLAWIVQGVGIGLGVGATASIARRLGKKENEKANSLAAQTVMVSIVISLVLTPLLILLIDPSIDLMGVTEIRDECHRYVTPMLAGSAVIVLNFVVAGLLRSEGSARKAMIVQISAAVIHMVLDPVFIYTLGMGLPGAAYATIAAAVISTAIGFYWYLADKMVVKLRMRHFRFKKDDCADVLNVGIPRAMEVAIIAVMSMVQRVFVIGCGGTEAVMFYNIPWNFVTLAQCVSQSLGSALIPVCVAALALGNRDKAADGYMYSLKISFISMAAIAALLIVFSDYAVMVFTYEPEMEALRPIFAHVLRIFALAIPMMALMDIGSSVLQSIRKAQMSMYSAFLRNLVVVSIVAWASTISLDTIYWGLLAGEIFGGFLMIGLAYKMFGYHYEWHLKRAV